MANQPYQHCGLALFVKSPEFSPVKTRLAAAIGEDHAKIIYEQCCLTLGEELLSSSLVKDGVITPYWAVAEKEGLALLRWQTMATLWQGTGQLGARLDHISRLLSNHYECTILIGADCPQVTERDLTQTLCLLEEGDSFVIGPAKDGGFYLFAATHQQVPSHVWTSIAYSTNSTGRELANKLEDIGSIGYLPEKSDLDTVTDIMEVYQDLMHLGSAQGPHHQRLSHLLLALNPRST